MAITFSAPEGAKAPASSHPAARARGKRGGHTKARPIDHISFDPSKPCRLRVGHLMTIYCVSHSGLYNMIKRGEVPPPDGYFGNGKKKTPFWLTTTVSPAAPQQGS